MDWVLRVEGVNLDDTVFNGNAISALRGASLVLEAFGYELSKELQMAGTPFEPVLLASSQSVFRLKDMDAAAAAGVRQLSRPA